ncbi:hypothetical protein MCEMSE15_02371 [Fimbriimonadaceae bacterium]
MKQLSITPAHVSRFLEMVQENPDRPGTIRPLTERELAHQARLLGKQASRESHENSATE